MNISSLTWGVKASFRGYVEAAGGSITVSDGATRAEDGAFVFNVVPGGDLEIGSDGSVSGSARFEGTVEFNAHGGMLSTTLTALGLETSDDGPVLTAALPTDERCIIANLGPVDVDADQTVTIGSQITLDGMYQIADNYPPGTELDPLRLE